MKITSSAIEIIGGRVAGYLARSILHKKKKKNKGAKKSAQYQPYWDKD